MAAIDGLTTGQRESIMEAIYTTPSLEPDDVIVSPPGLAAPGSILDKYIEASGGAQRLAGLTSFVGKGTSVGFGGFGGGGGGAPRSSCLRLRLAGATRSAATMAVPVG